MSTSEKIRITGRYYSQHPPENPQGEREEELELGLDDTAFFLIDVYGKGYDPDNELGDVPEMYSAAVKRNRELVRNSSLSKSSSRYFS